MTVDREARDQVAVDLRRLVTGRMINAEFDDRYYRCWKESQDLAVSEIAKFAWGLYGSDRSYRLKGRHAVSPEARRAAARAILFLHTNLEYQWPVAARNQPAVVTLARLLPPLVDCGVVGQLHVSPVGRLGHRLRGFSRRAGSLSGWLDVHGSRKERTLFIRSGDVDVWPFISRADFERARKKNGVACQRCPASGTAAGGRFCIVHRDSNSDGNRHGLWRNPSHDQGQDCQQSHDGERNSPDVCDTGDFRPTWIVRDRSVLKRCAQLATAGATNPSLKSS